MLERVKNLLAIFLTRYLMPRYEADKRAALLYTSASEVVLKRELAKYQKRAEMAEAHVHMFEDMSDTLVKKAHALPDHEQVSTSFVHDTITEIDNARWYVAQSR